MTRARRGRSGRSQKTPDLTGATEDGDTPAQTHQEGEEVTHAKTQDDKCPACKDTQEDTPLTVAEKEKWVRCDACKSWFHWRCVGEGGDLDAVGKWFCRPCLDANPARVITMKPPARKSTRRKTQRDYAGLNAGQETDPNRWLRMMEGKTIKKDPFRRMNGSEVGIEWLENDENAMKEPIVIESEEGLGMKMPPSSFTVNDVAESLSEDHPVEVIDVATQSNIPHWTLGKWAEYWNTEPSKRDKIRNVISLEISGTELADKVLPPRIVRELDWVEKFWPSTKKGRGHTYPKVQLYCLMGVGGAWTDWHVDFAGSSVYYHIIHGAKVVFYFIRPTPANLAAYEKWSGTELQNHSWLGDMCDEVFKVELKTGNTMIIPTGWIHAVYTPVDTLVFGGNFLHSYNVPTQLRVREIELATHVPKKFRFPYFVKLCWYAGEKYLRDLKAKEDFPPRILEGIEALADFLVSEARTMERGTDSAKRQAKEEVPGDRIKDAPALARELRWRAQHASGYSSDSEGRSSRHMKNKFVVNGVSDHATNGVGNKRKRSAADIGEDSTGLFRNFKPPGWERVDEHPAVTESRVVKARRPREDSTDWAEEWLHGDVNAAAEDGEEAHVERRRDVIVKVRRTAKGLERQTVERVLEEWQWVEGAPAGSSTVPTKSEPMDVTMTESHPPPSQASSDAQGDTNVAPTPGADTSPSGSQDDGCSQVAVEPS
ncbi:Clavaminate synthase-like protein [Lentinus tigrinus ALCF2SS1-7]|uniref:JmjC domain-containing histone demethylation protein 1 n=1 Tax=Lentinus tigrinus ALCF2SS1-6 TaxID=1328759 RepID=A0A5C2SPN8_9APHY|nr:Clavaminate synthase-like protein [Lentinus tigrinus ALCF2SS1-6]RPD79744.1 Clavaminate synthase-like protein [Lentinus tigrinus ALCF2SS1-7]